jgi:hypothetical protein
MPPNPRDNLRPGDLVPRKRVENVIADALYRPWNRGLPGIRQALAVSLVDRLLYFRLLAPDVEGMNTGAHQRPLTDAGWLPPHRVARLHEYAGHLHFAGAFTEAGILTAILKGEDPDYG